MKVHLLPLALGMVFSIILAGLLATVGIHAAQEKVEDALYWVRH